jgi:hypothetical protein
LDTRAVAWIGKHNVVFAHRILGILDFVCDPSSCRAQDTQSQLRDVAPVDALDGMSNQQIHDGGGDTEFGADAFEIATQAMRSDARSLAARCLAYSEDANQRPVKQTAVLPEII